MTRSLLPRSFRVLRHKSFALVVTGSVVSYLGTWMQYVGIGWAMRELTSSTFLLGLTFASQFGPSLFLGPVAGVWADRFDRRTTIVLGNIGMAIPAAATGALLTWGEMTEFWLLFLTAVGGAAFALTTPATMAVVPSLVGQDEVTQAIALNSSVVNLTRIAGPSLGGLVIRFWGVDWAFYVNAISFVAVVLAWIPIRLGPLPPLAAESFTERLRGGYRHVRAHPVLGHLMALSAVFSLLVFHAPLMPVFARDVLDEGVSAYAWLASASGVGAVFGATIAGELVGDRARRAAIGIGAMTVSVALLGFALSRSLPLSLACLAVFGFGYFMLMATVTSLVMLLSPDHVRGRVMGLLSIFTIGSVPIAGVAGGALATWLGAPWTVGLGAGAMSLYVLWFLLTGPLRLVVTPGGSLTPVSAS